VVQTINHLLNDVCLVQLVELEREGLDDMILLVKSQGIVEKLSLIVVLLEFDRSKALLDSRNFLWVSVRYSEWRVSCQTGYPNVLSNNASVFKLTSLRSSSAKSVGPIIHTLRDLVAHGTIPVEVHNGTHWYLISIESRQHCDYHYLVC
jgi:hypothetical protein